MCFLNFIKIQILEFYYKNLKLDGEYNSDGRVSDCGSESHGFKSHYLPCFEKNIFSLIKTLNEYLNIKKWTFKTKF